MAFGMLCQEGTTEIGTECFSPRQPAQKLTNFPIENTTCGYNFLNGIEFGT